MLKSSVLSVSGRVIVHRRWSPMTMTAAARPWGGVGALAFHHDHSNCNHGDDCNHEDTVVTRCTAKISSLLSPVRVNVTSSNSDPNGSHIRVEVVSSQFEGKNIVQRQRLVYKALWEELNGPVHAVDSISAKTPAEAGL